MSSGDASNLPAVAEGQDRMIAATPAKNLEPLLARLPRSGRVLLGHPVTTLAFDEAVQRARRYGIGWVNVRGSSHHGASGCYVYDAARLGLVGLAPDWRGRVWFATADGVAGYADPRTRAVRTIRLGSGEGAGAARDSDAKG